MEARIAICVMVAATIVAGIVLRATPVAGWRAALLLWASGFVAVWAEYGGRHAIEQVQVWAFMGAPACLAFCYVIKRISWEGLKRCLPGRSGEATQRPLPPPMIRL